MADTDDINKRLVRLETESAVDNERYKNIVGRLEKIENGMSKLLWLVIAIIVGGVTNFILQGGLNASQIP